MTNNFKKEEFRSNDGSHFPYEVKQNLKVLAEQLEVLREYLGKPIKINSGYRSPEWNKKIGGTENSQHVLGKASDIVVDGLSPKDVADAIEELISEGKMLEGGLGRYDSFTHYDIRGKKSRWDNNPKPKAKPKKKASKKSE